MKKRHHILLNSNREPMMGSTDIAAIFHFIAGMNPLHTDKADISIAKNSDNEEIIHCDWNSDLIENFAGYVVHIDIYPPMYGGHKSSATIQERITELQAQLKDLEEQEDYRGAHFIQLEIAHLSDQIIDT